ncbi:MAG: carboxylesterase family protein [Gammaproteobacteria bacterium]|nr:carboxylesterase family protein [Gammaproteobacteria bacterium]
MRRAAIILIVMLIGATVFFATQDPPVSPALAPSNTIANDLTSRTTSGDVVGFIGDEGARSWLGIPFAKPPIGNLRWRAPLPPEPWNDVRVAKQVSDLCPQLNSATASDEVSATPTVVGSEDCLYLNVYAPASASNRPVMFWIHGGGNSVGDGGSYNASRLAVSQDVVVITINYRLAHLGWFSHPALVTGQPLDDSGNYGTLDIIRALEWTRDNAAGFGGDPDNVTVFGESAGASDTMTMVASPLARGLFHRGIVQSGGLRISPVEFVQAYASQGGHPYSSREIVSHLLIADGLASDAITAQTYQDAMTADELRVYLYRKTPRNFSPHSITATSA